MGGAGPVILFVFFFVGCSIWTVLYLLLAAHYFLTIIIESSAGNDEVQFPTESVIERWWKPVFCLWILSIWVVPAAMINGPLMAGSPIAFGIGFGVLLALAFPLSLLSALYSQSWFFVIHPLVVWRLVRHFRTFAYVYAVTLATLAATGGMVAAVFCHTVLWALPASFAIPTTLLLYARHWGRFAWLALNFDVRPQKKKKRDPADSQASNGASDAPEPDVKEVGPITEAAEELLSFAFPTALLEYASAWGRFAWRELGFEGRPQKKKIRDPVDAKTPDAANAIPEVDVEEVAPAADAVPEGLPAAPDSAVEEEDEWSTNKAPYGLTEDKVKPVLQESASFHVAEVAAADQPLSLAKYYDDEAKKAIDAEEKKLADAGQMPLLRNKNPSFQIALLRGVWEFMIYSHTIQVWINLVFLTAIELFLLMMIRNLLLRILD